MRDGGDGGQGEGGNEQQSAHHDLHAGRRLGFNVHDSARNGDQLADLANRVLNNSNSWTNLLTNSTVNEYAPRVAQLVARFSF